ncbi:hypothetical protein ABT297_39840 [Dactylosporangium sp. NPDC000555]|uniref:hypothetical protein n=1 Tax=Dactylosporangium sp. NPDC000555 TaxID=3154260 RepID=UPI00332F8636
MTVVAGVLPIPLSESAQGLVAEHVGARAAREIRRGRTVNGPVLWARDAYGSRWAVVAPFASASGQDRWYLWDVDACGSEVVTVHSGFHPSAESAMAAWQEVVGHTAAGAASSRRSGWAEKISSSMPSSCTAGGSAEPPARQCAGGAGGRSYR